MTSQIDWLRLVFNFREDFWKKTLTESWYFLAWHRFLQVSVPFIPIRSRPIFWFAYLKIHFQADINRLVYLTIYPANEPPIYTANKEKRRKTVTYPESVDLLWVTKFFSGSLRCGDFFSVRPWVWCGCIIGNSFGSSPVCGMVWCGWAVELTQGWSWFKRHKSNEIPLHQRKNFSDASTN